MAFLEGMVWLTLYPHGIMGMEKGCIELKVLTVLMSVSRNNIDVRRKERGGQQDRQSHTADGGVAQRS